MAMVVPLSTDDGRGGKQGLLWDRRTGWLTVVMRVSPFGLDLADGEQADEWVAGFGGFLAALGRQPIVRHIAVTVDTAPSGGTAMRDHIVARIDPGSPDAAREVMRELADAASTCCADVDTRLSITFDPARAHPRPTDLMAGVAEVTRSLPGLEASLAKSGVAVLGRASLTWLIGRLRTAYDPTSRGEVGRVDDGPGCEEILLWEEAGPLRATETWELWRHDSGVSVSWALSEAPRQPVLARVLAPLVAPGPFPRRITLFYEPLPAGVAADEVDRQSAEAAGAGAATFTLYVTTTVLTSGEDLLDAATADVEQRAGQCRLRLRRLRGAQQAGFAAALGLGIDPIELARRGHR
jgi:hypothetical protein